MAANDILSSIGAFVVPLLGILGGLLLFGIIIWLVLWYKKYSRYDTTVMIRHAGSQRITWDKGGFFTNKVLNAKKFHLYRSGKSFSGDSITYLSSEGKKFTEFVQVGESGMRPAKIVVNPDSIKVTVNEEDVNWALDSFNSFQKAFKMDLAQLLAIAAFMFVALLIVVLIFYLLKQTPEMLAKQAEMMNTMLEISKNLAQGRVIQ